MKNRDKMKETARIIIDMECGLIKCKGAGKDGVNLSEVMRLMDMAETYRPAFLESEAFRVLLKIERMKRDMGAAEVRQRQMIVVSEITSLIDMELLERLLDDEKRAEIPFKVLLDVVPKYWQLLAELEGAVGKDVVKKIPVLLADVLPNLPLDRQEILSKKIREHFERDITVSVEKANKERNG